MNEIAFDSSLRKATERDLALVRELNSVLAECPNVRGKISAAVLGYLDNEHEAVRITVRLNATQGEIRFRTVTFSSQSSLRENIDLLKQCLREVSPVADGGVEALNSRAGKRKRAVDARIAAELSASL